VGRNLGPEESEELLDLELRVRGASQVEVVSHLLQVNDTGVDKSGKDILDGLFEASVELGDLAFLVQLRDNGVQLFHDLGAVEDEALLTNRFDCQESDLAAVEQMESQSV